MAVATVIEEQKKRIEETALITGSEAIAVACKLADVDVITAYPIRPYDTVMQYVCKLVANGEMDCEYIVAEGEHSQFEIVKHASACGAPLGNRRPIDVSDHASAATRPRRTCLRTVGLANSVVRNGRKNAVPIVSPAMLCGPQSGTLVMPRNTAHAIAAFKTRLNTPAPTPCSSRR